MDESKYDKVWKELGIEKGDDITYFDFYTTCEDIGVDPDDINIDIFCEKYHVNIG